MDSMSTPWAVWAIHEQSMSTPHGVHGVHGVHEHSMGTPWAVLLKLLMECSWTLCGLHPCQFNLIWCKKKFVILQIRTPDLRGYNKHALNRWATGPYLIAQIRATSTHINHVTCRVTSTNPKRQPQHPTEPPPPRFSNDDDHHHYHPHCHTSKLFYQYGQNFSLYLTIFLLF